jgi:hypothetical protein
MSNTENTELATGALSHLSVELGTTSDELDSEPCLLIAIRHAWDGNYDQAGAYMNLAADKLEKKGRLVQAKALRDALANLKNNSQIFCA